MTSLHQLNMVKSTPMRPEKNTYDPTLWPKIGIPFIQEIAPIAKTSAERAPTSGHGLGSTRW